jgi:hypothetical protein
MVAFLTFPTRDSSLVYSSDYIKSKAEVDKTFYSIVNRVFSTQTASWFAVDSSGAITRYGSVIGGELLKDMLPIFELIESTPAARSEFKTMELGCCVAYSHHRFKTKCIACAIIAEDLRPLIDQVTHFIQYF